MVAKIDMTETSKMQSVARAARILRTLAEVPGEDGWARLAEIAAATGIHRATVHRFLQAWQFEGWVERDADSRRYRVGLPLLALSGTAVSRSRFLSVARPAVAALAEKTGDTAYLFQYSGLDGICMERQAGGYPVQSLATGVGDAVPLGRTAGTVAILAGLDDRTVANAIDENRQRNTGFARFDRNHYLNLVKSARQQGYAETEGIVPGVRGFGVVVRGSGGQIVGGLSLAVIKDRLDEEHREVVFKALNEQAEHIRRALNPDIVDSSRRKVV